MKSKVIPGSIWTTTDFVFFVIEKTEENDAGVWVFYHKKENVDQKYHCLIGAFLNRFTNYENS